MTKIIISYLKPFLARNTIRISFSLPPPYALKVPPQKKTGGGGAHSFAFLLFVSERLDLIELIIELIAD